MLCVTIYPLTEHLFVFSDNDEHQPAPVCRIIYLLTYLLKNDELQSGHWKFAAGVRGHHASIIIIIIIIIHEFHRDASLETKLQGRQSMYSTHLVVSNSRTCSHTVCCSCI